MKIELRFFASLREVLACSQETMIVPESLKTIADLRSFLRQRGSVWAEALAEGKPIRCALNHQMVDFQTNLEEGAEVAFFPPVTGG